MFVLNSVPCTFINSLPPKSIATSDNQILIMLCFKMNTTSGLLSFDTHWEFKFPYFVCVATSNKQENIWLLLGVTNEVIFRSSDLQQQYIWKYNPFHFSSMYRNKVLWLMAWRNEDWRREQMDVWLPASSASVCAHLTRDFLLLYHLNPIILWAFPVKNDGTCLYCLVCICIFRRTEDR